MAKCEECGRKMRLLEGYNHPTMGKNYLLCSNCYDQVSESVENWTQFVLSNSFNNEVTTNGFQLSLKNIFSGVFKIKKNV